MKTPIACYYNEENDDTFIVFTNKKHGKDVYECFGDDGFSTVTAEYVNKCTSIDICEQCSELGHRALSMIISLECEYEEALCIDEDPQI